MRKQYWLFKSDPDAFGISDLMEKPGQTEPWDGACNYQARNFLRDAVCVPVPLSLLKTIPALKQMRLLQRGNRLSILPVQQHEARIILALAKA